MGDKLDNTDVIFKSQLMATIDSGKKKNERTKKKAENLCIFNLIFIISRIYRLPSLQYVYQMSSLLTQYQLGFFIQVCICPIYLTVCMSRMCVL